MFFQEFLSDLYIVTELPETVISVFSGSVNNFFPIRDMNDFMESSTTRF
jgi:hypothetical protein